jgi:Zn-dependent protease
MSKCYHCGEEYDQLFQCEKCKQKYCHLHKDPIDHECNLVLESQHLQETSNQYGYQPAGVQEQSALNYNLAPQNLQDQSPYTRETYIDNGERRGTTDGSFTWYRRETNIPENAFDPDSGIEFKGILLPYKSEFLHLLIGAILIFLIGLLGFYNPDNQEILNAMGYGWVIFMVAGFYTTAFLFHEFGHRQVAIHFGLQTKFRLLKFGMIITLFGLAMGVISLLTQSPSLPALALPGAVVVLGLDKVDRTTGLCKAAGPTINLIYGTILFMASFLVPIYPINLFIGISASLNFMLGLFNLIPVGILDGENIFKWNKKVYFFLVISMLVLIVINYICIYAPSNVNPYYNVL